MIDTSSQHVYEVRPRKRKRGVDLISDALPFGRLCDGVAQQMISSGDATLQSSATSPLRTPEIAQSILLG